MNTLQINKILEQNPVTREAYIGCFAADKIPRHLIPNFFHCMVVNIDPSNSKGTHWISLYCKPPLYLEYYDPLGIWPPPSEYIIDYLAKFKQIKYNRASLQSPYSRTCGKHAIFFLFNRCLGAKFENIVAFLHSAKSSPDNVVNSFIKNAIFSKHV